MSKESSSKLPDPTGSPTVSYDPLQKTRRSSVFKRRSSILSAPPIKLSDVARHKQYIAEAKAEMSEWMNLYNKRRSITKTSEKNLLELKANKPWLDLEDAKKYLDKEDLEILSSRPDYSRINRDVDEFLNNVEMLKKKLQMLHSARLYNEMAAQAHLNSVGSCLSSYNYKHADWVQKP